MRILRGTLLNEKNLLFGATCFSANAGRHGVFENNYLDKMKTALYFGYGSNMSTQYLIKRRKIIPHESKVGVLKDYQLIMNMGGPNFLEPSFGNIGN